MTQPEQMDLTCLDDATPTTEPMPDPEVIEPPKALAERPRVTEIEGGKIQLHDASQVSQLAAFVEQSSLTIGGAKSRADVTLALMAGLEAGLTATQTVKNIMVVNGKATIWGDALVALALASGECAGIDIEHKGEGDGYGAHVTVHRMVKLWNGEGSLFVHTSSFTVADAKAAKLWGKSGPWSNYPDRMLMNRARTFAIRDAFADKIGGLSVREEVDDYAAFDPSQMAVSTRPSITPQIEGADDDN